jgi:STE24 endopeptidase
VNDRVIFSGMSRIKLRHGAVLALLLFGSCLPCRALDAYQVPEGVVSPTVPSSSRDKVYSYSLPPDKERKAIALSGARTILHFASIGISILIYAGLLFTGLSSRFARRVGQLTRRGFLQALLFVPGILLLVDLLHLPLAIYGHHLSLEYGLSVQGWTSWTWDVAKGEILKFVVGVPILWGVYLLIRKSPKRWWFYIWLAAFPVVLFFVFITPTVVDPLFNRFVPLSKDHPDLVEKLETVVSRGGLAIPADRMFEMKASEKTRTLNAYVTGIGATKRVVVWDTTMQQLDVPQTLFVFGHEMGHYVLNHIWKGLAFGAALLFVGAWLLFIIVGTVQKRWGARLSISATSDWASLPLILLVMVVLSFLAEPIENGVSRYIEHQADVYGLEITHDITPDSGQVAAQSFQVLGETSLEEPAPHPAIVFWLYSHPPIAERVRFALDYDPWTRGGEPAFVK